MNVTVLFTAIFGVSVLCGFRAFTPIAVVSWLAVWGWMPVAGSPFWFVGKEIFAIAISILAVVELIGDKLPKTPSRIQLMPLAARFVTGGVCAGAFAFSAGQWWLPGLVLGGAGSLVGAFTGYYARREIVQRLRIPDMIVALLEDFVTVAGTLLLVHNFFHTPV
jgi:uncharacterized membrane protein